MRFSMLQWQSIRQGTSDTRHFFARFLPEKCGEGSEASRSRVSVFLKQTGESATDFRGGYAEVKKICVRSE